MCDMFPFIEDLEKMMAMIAQIEEREKGFSGAVMFSTKQTVKNDQNEQQLHPKEEHP